MKLNFKENLVLYLFTIKKNLLEYQTIKEFGLIIMNLNLTKILQNIIRECF